jgi:hypothetical protein
MAINRSNMGKEIQKASSSPSAKKKIATVMDEYGKGILTSGSGKKVTNRDQALAIAMSEARGAAKRAQMGMGVTSYRDSLNRRFGNPEIPMMRDVLMRKAKGMSMPRKTAKEEMMENMLEDPRNRGDFLRNAARDLRNVPEYTEKERRLIQEQEQKKLRRQGQEAHERVTGRKLPKGD